jgi:hypothetical protein
VWRCYLTLNYFFLILFFFSFFRPDYFSWFAVNYSCAVHHRLLKLECLHLTIGVGGKPECASRPHHHLSMRPLLQTVSVFFSFLASSVKTIIAWARGKRKSEWARNAGWFLFFYFLMVCRCNGSGVGAARDLRCSTLFTRVVTNFILVFHPMDGRVVGVPYFDGIVVETGAESGQRVTCAVRHSLQEW